MFRPSRRRALTSGLLALALAGTAVGTTVAAAPASADSPPPINALTVPPPQSDPFYASPNPLPTVPPGAVLDSRPVDVSALGLPLPVRAWQIKYRSTDAHGQPDTAIATVVLPAGAAPPGGRPLLAYDPANDSLAPTCRPSYTMVQGLEPEEALMALALGRNWAIVVSDYTYTPSSGGGLLDFTAGVPTGYAVLDGVRAAERFAPLGLGGAGTPVGIWGYSGGGLASTWAAEEQPGYAPELNVRGVAAGGVPPNVKVVAKNIDGTAFFGIALAGVWGLNQAYPEYDIGGALNDAGRQAVASISTECIAQYTVQFAFHHLNDYTTVPDTIDLPSFQPLLNLDTLGQHVPTAPIYAYHAYNDELIPYGSAHALWSKYCAEGVRVDLQTSFLDDHISYAVTGAPGAVQYLADRFAGTPAPSNC
jgi:hypothetical protein